jgi:hypothetical protein
MSQPLPEHGVYVSDVNMVMVFHDEQGRAWLAAGVLGELVRYDDGIIVEQLQPEAIKDRAFMLSELKLVAKT